jgi:hypothetical protein
VAAGTIPSSGYPKPANLKATKTAPVTLKWTATVGNPKKGFIKNFHVQRALEDKFEDIAITQDYTRKWEDIYAKPVVTYKYKVCGCLVSTTWPNMGEEWCIPCTKVVNIKAGA